MSDRRVILPNEAARHGGLTVLVPKGYEDEGFAAPFYCRVPLDMEFTPCMTPLMTPREYERHVVRCTRGHMDIIMALRPSQRNPLFAPGDTAWDPEIRAHMDKVGERMLREGRLEVRPHERAGFS